MFCSCLAHNFVLNLLLHAYIDFRRATTCLRVSLISIEDKDFIIKMNSALLSLIVIDNHWEGTHIFISKHRVVCASNQFVRRRGEFTNRECEELTW